MHEKESPFLSLNGLESARKWIESFHRAKESIYILMVTNQFLLKESLVTEDLIFGLNSIIQNDGAQQKSRISAE